MIVEGIEVIGDVSMKEAAEYVKRAPRNTQAIVVEIDGEYANIWYHIMPVPFERIRRITGYLVGSIDRFNDAKKAEVNDRVKHAVKGGE